VKNITGGAVLTEEDLAPILKNFKHSLMSRNVAAEVSDKLADSVRTSLLGKTTDRFTSMSATVKAVLQDAMETLLTPKKSIDVLRAALAAKNAGRVYTIVFLGVNGVGKSTNLAKVAYYLKHKGGLDVLICACDTFRAGAVEQLKTHSRCLDVPLFERGYGKDPADIAKHAIAHAGSTGMDVVLVDTAGRMQDNEPLMRALAKLVAVNSPDLVLFVGEALVGNDAIDQVTKFNRSLVDMSHDPRNPRGIDGMLLTKYDTVDDKVGAALSMVYVTGQPIVFVGCGQKYQHLRKMKAKEVVKTLLG
jgi:signal recognition particle receptor subunit alpha